MSKNKNRWEAKEKIMNIIFTDRSRRNKAGRQRNDFFLILLGTNRIHLNALGLDIRDAILALLRVQALVTVFIPLFELHVGRRARTPKNSNPIPKDASLGEWSVSVSLGKLVRVEIFSGSFATAN